MGEVEKMPKRSKPPPKPPGCGALVIGLGVTNEMLYESGNDDILDREPGSM